MRTPAPTQIQKRSHSPRRGRSRTGPRAHTVRPYGVCSAGANPGDWATARVAPTAKTGAFSKDGGRGKPLPYERNARFRVCAGEPLGAPAEMWAAFQEPTLIRHGFAVPPSPLEGEGLRAAARAAPTVGNGPGVLVRQTQAQKWSRTRSNFPQSQGPVARREFRVSLRFCAPEGFCLLQGVTPVTGVLGGRRIWTRSVHPEPSP